ncbi:MAG: hypothetical protein HC773_32055 [Scytonema sp. CRU_2_7]|nr:hypothetical protein [Scytonema sp. CRU_2_7]
MLFSGLAGCTAWDDAPKPTSRPRRSAEPTRESNNNSGRDSFYSAAPESKPRPNPAEFRQKSMSQKRITLRMIWAINYDDTDLSRNYEDQSKPIPGDYVVDYQPLENERTDDDYDDYDDDGFKCP